MTKQKENPYQNFSSFVVRSPLFPLDFIWDLTSKDDLTVDQFLEVCKLPVVDEAIFLASPDLHSQFHEYLKGNLKDRKKIERLHYALMRYILRMCGRPTPFGLFAGFCIGQWGDKTDVQHPPQARYTRHTRLDMNYLCALAQDLAQHPTIKPNLKYFPNSSIYPVGDHLRYVEYRYRNTRRTHHIVAVDRSEYLEKVLEKASKGAHVREMAELLEDKENDISLAEAIEFIDELINSQLLVNELEPAITGPEFLDQILTVLEDKPGTDEIKNVILKTKATLDKMDDSKIGTTVALYHQIAKDLEPLETGFELKFLFQTDMVKPVQPGKCMLNQDIADDVLEAVEVFNKLTLRPSSTNIDSFRDAFFERYETREVPLLQALDTEAGVGYRQSNAGAGDIAPLVDDLAVPAPSGGGGQEIRWNSIQALLFKKYRESLEGDRYSIEITGKDVESFESTWDDLPDTLASMVQIVEDADPADPDSRAVVFVGGLGGSGAGNLLGRFCHADEATDTFVREITAKEAEMNPDAIIGEIIHLPESRVGNVMLRPVLRDYEIPYLAKPAVSEEFQLKLEDLMVSVRGNRVVLRSKRLNKQIIPRLTNAHNFSFNALPIYHFLAELQTQGLRGSVGFNWGVLSNEYDFLPRVTYKNLIFFPATWNIRSEEINGFFEKKDDKQLLESIREWREKKKIPAHVALVDSDNKLYINLENIMCIKTLYSVTKKRQGFQLMEYLYTPGNDRGVIKSKEGTFCNEVVICYYNTAKPRPSTGDQPGDKPGPGNGR
ncbi:MAG: hypothetical protein GY940_15175 [bacterium]|nr:hypothetical protein [bacterium]